MQSFNRYLTQAEERQLFRHIKQFGAVYARRDLAWMRLARNTGLRVGTMAGLTVMDARQALASGYLHIRSEIAKRKQAHTVHLNKAAGRALRDLLAIRREMGQAESDEAALIVSRNHRALSVRSFQARMNLWVKGAGLPVAATPHWFRHTLAMRLMRNSTAQDPRGVVQGVLGHRDINSTAVYTRPSREDLSLALDEVAA
ncbi:MAG: tyrosine-type recombinase/integrase [Wenzhouxiangella sp.]